MRKELSDEEQLAAISATDPRELYRREKAKRAQMSERELEIKIKLAMKILSENDDHRAQATRGIKRQIRDPKRTTNNPTGRDNGSAKKAQAGKTISGKR